MELAVTRTEDGLYRLSAAGFAMRCAVGRSGLTSAKREGDGGTPIGRFPLREAFYRPDRIMRPSTRLSLTAIAPGDGWCDDPAAPEYNRPVQLPFAASHERMWRDDSLYDVVVPLGYNDDPPVAGLGSAIFLHVCRSDYEPTAGCVAVPLEELLKLLVLLGPGDMIAIG
jgi:L,D-peptidoglycan transpeptidase YkuD (ErfK/YbiS/YcfS/YnhG family)